MHIQEEIKFMKLVPHIRDEDLKVPFADKHVMREFLLREFDHLNAFVTDVEGTRDVYVSAPDGVTIRIQPVDREIHAIEFHHTTRIQLIEGGIRSIESPHASRLDRRAHIYELRFTPSSADARFYFPSTSVKEADRYYHLVLRADAAR